MAVLGRGAVSFERGAPVREQWIAGSAATLCTGGPGVIRNEAWPLYGTIFGVRLCWELEEPKGLKVSRSSQDTASVGVHNHLTERSN